MPDMQGLLWVWRHLHIHMYVCAHVRLACGTEFCVVNLESLQTWTGPRLDASRCLSAVMLRALAGGRCTIVPEATYKESRARLAVELACLLNRQ